LSSSPGARARAGVRWAMLADRLRTVSPQALTKGGIAALVVGAAAALSVATWPTLAPFLVGIVIAYAVLPIANRLDAFMPRVLAALLAELVAVAILVGVLVIVVPPILQGLVQVATRLPTGDELRAQLAGLQAELGDLPEPLRTIVLAVATESAANLQGAINGFVDSAASVVSSQILGAFNTLSFVLGLLVIPAWVLTLVADERRLARRAGSLLPVAMRADAAAIVAIVDRAFGTFLRHRVLLALVSGVLVWAGLEVTNAMGLTQVRYAATAGTLLGFLQLIPELGFFLGLFPILLFIPLSGPVAALTAFVVYWLAVRTADGLVGGRVSRGVLDVHPAVLLPAIVVLSQFGVGWLIAAAPVIAIIRDLVRYAYGRLSDPPLPAGVLPGAGRVPAAAAAVRVRVPSVYRGTAIRPAGSTARSSGAVPTLAASRTVRARSQSRGAIPPSAPEPAWRPTP
jgi:predicted PurR-regulated permease PerM